MTTATIQHLKIITLLFICMLCSAALRAETAGHFAIDSERVHQSFDQSSSDIDTVTLSPSLDIDNWTLSASIPWQHVDGSYFVNNRYPNRAHFCNQISQLSAKQRYLLVQSGKLTLGELRYCKLTGGVQSATLQNSTEGMNDVEVSADYYLPPYSHNVNGSLGFGYKHDNGDPNSGLGTGTREAYLETDWSLMIHQVGVAATLGYQFILSNDTGIDMQDYAYGSLDSHWVPYHFLTLGLTYNYIQANAKELKDLDYVTGYLEIGRSKGFSVRLGYTDYNNADGYPNKEYSGSISYRF